MSFSAGPPMPPQMPMRRPVPPTQGPTGMPPMGPPQGPPMGAPPAPVPLGPPGMMGPPPPQGMAPPGGPPASSMGAPPMGGPGGMDPMSLMQMLMSAMQPPQVDLDESKLRAYSVQDPGVWGKRNMRMLRHRRLYELVKPPRNRLKPGMQASVTTDAKAIVHKFAGMFAKHGPATKCIPGDDQNIIAAERAADFLRSCRRKEIRIYGQGPHGSRPFDEAVYLTRDGALVDLVTLDPTNPSYPFKTMLLDPMTVYPTYSGDDLIRVTVKYRTTLAEARDLCEQYGRQDLVEPLGTTFRQDSSPVEIVKVFAKNKENKQWEIGVLVKNQMVTAQQIGYCPLVITYANARIYSTTTSGEMTSLDRYENVGTGVFDVIEEAIRNKNEDYSIMREMMKKDANPPRVIFTDDEGKLDELKFEPGQNVHLWADDKFQLVQLTPDFRKIQALLQLDQEGINHGTFPDAIWGEGNFTSSAQEYFALGNARDQIFVFQDALERHYEAKYTRFLEIYRDYGAKANAQSPQPGATFAASQPSTGIKLGGQEFSVADVEALGPEPDVEVTYSDVTPQNEASRANIANTLVTSKILDLHTARELGIPAPYNEQPELIGQRVLQDVSLMNPQMTQIMAMTAALYSPDPVMRQIAKMMLPNLITQAQMSAQPQQGGGPNGGPNPTPGQNGVPASNKSMPAQGVPPEAGSTAGQPTGPAAPAPASQPGQPS